MKKRSGRRPERWFRRRDVCAPEALPEAYDYDKPVPFSRGMRIDIGRVRLILISGTASVGPDGKSKHPGDLTAQAWRTFRNVKALLEAEGATWQHVVRTTIYLRDMNRYHELNRVRMEFFKDEGIRTFPASTCIQARLCRDDLLVEMEAIAILQAGRRRRRSSKR